jgi:hypothetical protein
LKTLVAGLRFERRLINKQAPMINARRSSAPTMDPMTIPAMAPPLRPLLLPADAAPAPAVAAPVAVVVKVVMGCREAEATTGRTTPSQRLVVLEKTQQESVALGELAAQYEHSEPRLVL